MVTRTITTTKVNVLCLDIEHAEPCNRVITIPRTYKDEETILKKVKPLLETDTLKVVHVVDTETEETLYGMTEQEFVELAQAVAETAIAAAAIAAKIFLIFMLRFSLFVHSM